MDLPIKHDAFAGRGLTLRTAGFFKGPRLIIDGGEVKGKRLRFSLRDNAGHEREIRLKTNGLDPVPKVQIGTKRSSSLGRWLGTNTCGWRSLSPLSSSAAAWVHCLDLSRCTRAPGSFEASVARPPSTVSAR